MVALNSCKPLAPGRFCAECYLVSFSLWWQILGGKGCICFVYLSINDWVLHVWNSNPLKDRKVESYPSRGTNLTCSRIPAWLREEETWLLRICPSAHWRHSSQVLCGDIFMIVDSLPTFPWYPWFLATSGCKWWILLNWFCEYNIIYIFLRDSNSYCSYSPVKCAL
jgi:hypothetical protein